MRGALRGLDSRNAERVAQHLVVAGSLVDEDPEQALAHARAARDRASRIAVVREAVGVAAYHAGDWAEAARELRAYRRMTGDESYRAVLADCERALGRPEIALRLVGEALADHPDPEETAELQLVEAGARRDLGEVPAARLVLETALGGRPRPDQLEGADAGTLRLAAAYADLLREDGDVERAEQWTAALALADTANVTGMGIEEDIAFGEEELETAEDETTTPASAQESGLSGADGDTPQENREAALEDEGEGEDEDEVAHVDGVVLGPEDDDLDFDAQVEAEVAELLGETGKDGEGQPGEGKQPDGPALPALDTEPPAQR